LRRLLCSIGLAAIFVLHSAIAFAAPTPSPGLDGILIKPPGTGYKEEPKATAGIIEGPFDAAQYAQVTAAPDAAATAAALAQDGFLSGYGRTWVSAGNAHVFVEAVVAFAGAKGAKAWLRQSETADKADPSYAQALTISGIDTYYGARLIDKVHKIYGDAFVFAKGNDVILVTYVSSKNDLGTIAAAQAKRQFDAAPPYTIPPDQWPESNVVASSPFAGLKTIGLIVGALIILGLLGAGGFILLVSAPAQAPGHSGPGPSRVCVRDLGRGSANGRDSACGRRSHGSRGSRCGCASNSGRPLRDVRGPPLLVGWRCLEGRRARGPAGSPAL